MWLEKVVFGGGGWMMDSEEDNQPANSWRFAKTHSFDCMANKACEPRESFELEGGEWRSKSKYQTECYTR